MFGEMVGVITGKLNLNQRTCYEKILPSYNFYINADIKHLWIEYSILDKIVLSIMMLVNQK